MTSNITKAQKRRLRELTALVHEADLDRSLGELMEHFRKWEAGEQNAHELNEEIHRFHDGESRNLYKLYVMGSTIFAVAQAVHIGLLDRTSIEADILELLEPDLKFLRDLDDEMDDDR